MCIERKAKAKPARSARKLMPKRTAEKEGEPPSFSDAERAGLGGLLTALKVWWLTPLGATGEKQRVEVVVDAIETVRGISSRR